MDNRLYPSNYELLQVLQNMVSSKFINSFAQRKGIFITNATKNEIAVEISRLFFEDEELEEIRKEAYQIKNKHSLSGFSIKSSYKDFSLKKNYDWLIENAKIPMNSTLSSLHKIKDSNKYKGTYAYNKQKPGRIEFLQDEKTSFDFYIEEIADGNWQVELDSTKSTDLKELQELFNETLKKEEVIETIDEKLLSTELSIRFFDQLSKFGISGGLQLIQIKHLSIKQGKYEDPEEESIEEVAEKDLQGITQAILEGQNLRENSFVIGAVKSGYSFNAMTYEFENTKEPYIFQIRAEFKGRPKVFEVTIVSYEEVLGTNKTRNPIFLGDHYNMQLRSKFWNFAKDLFNGLIKRA